MSLKLQSGKYVTILPKWLMQGEEQVIYEVIEDREDRLLISPISWKYAIRPKELVSVDMVEQISICQ